MGDSIAEIDSLTDQSTFLFEGVAGKVTFDSKNPPDVGNIFSLEIVKPIMPNIQDKYKFSIKGPVINISKQTSEMNKIRVVPNPYLVSSIFEPELGELRLEPLRQIQFINLPSKCTIYIFTVAGDRVKTLYHNFTKWYTNMGLKDRKWKRGSTGSIYICS
ncbi:MAG: hypothetical protein U5K00_00430 [Melioribacteraceae bacterium]|nr:hypothetical protein [Melioribacteraceae bacterium]